MPMTLRLQMALSGKEGAALLSTKVLMVVGKRFSQKKTVNSMRRRQKKYWARNVPNFSRMEA